MSETLRERYKQETGREWWWQIIRWEGKTVELPSQNYEQWLEKLAESLQAELAGWKSGERMMVEDYNYLQNVKVPDLQSDLAASKNREEEFKLRELRIIERLGGENEVLMTQLSDSQQRARRLAETSLARLQELYDKVDESPMDNPKRNQSYCQGILDAMTAIRSILSESTPEERTTEKGVNK